MTSDIDSMTNYAQVKLTNVIKTMKSRAKIMPGSEKTGGTNIGPAPNRTFIAVLNTDKDDNLSLCVEALIKGFNLLSI